MQKSKKLNVKQSFLTFTDTGGSVATLLTALAAAARAMSAMYATVGGGARLYFRGGSSLAGTKAEQNDLNLLIRAALD